MSGTIADRVLEARRRRFERLVARALDELPPELLAMLENVAVTVEDEPRPEQLASLDGLAHPGGGSRDGGPGLRGPRGGAPEAGAVHGTAPDPEPLFGLYEGTPRTERDSAYGYGMTLPDRITIFRGPLERAFRSPQAIAREVRITVAHELGHHFGLDEERLEELGLG